MGILLSEVQDLIVKSKTHGGETYLVKLHGDDTYRELCFRPLVAEGQEDRYCSHIAGYGTTHKYQGRCHIHMGKGGRPVVHGRYSNAAKGQLREAYNKLENDPQYANLQPELAMARTILRELVKEYQAGTRNTKLVHQMLVTIGTISSTLDTMKKIEDRTVLTAAAAQYAMAKAIDVARRYIPEREFHAFYEDWKMEVMMQRYGSEVTQAYRIVDGDWSKEE